MTKAATIDRSELRSVPLSAIGTLFWLTIRQHARGRRLLVLAGLFTIPAILAIIIRALNANANLVHVEFGLLFIMVPYTLVPLTAVLYASGMIQDEIEEQTLTYLLVRPLSKPVIYLVKLLATILVALALVVVFTFVTYLALLGGTPGWQDTIATHAPRLAVLFGLSVLGYCCLFGCISLYTRHSLVAAVAYIVLFEGVLANFDFAVRRITFMYYFRVLVERWIRLNWRVISPGGDPWSIDLAKAPPASTCVQTILVVCLVTIVLAAYTFNSREFRMKTPEGS